METTTSPTANLKQESIKNGLIMAGISIVLILVMNYVLPEMLGSVIINITQIIIGVLVAIALCLDMRKKAGGYWSFSQALGHIFVMFMISAAIVYFFTIAFGKYIDTTYPVRMKEIITAKSESMFKSLGMEGEAMDKAMEKQAHDLEKQFDPNFSQMVVSIGIQLVFYFVGALIFAAIFKKERPLYQPTEE